MRNELCQLYIKTLVYDESLFILKMPNFQLYSVRLDQQPSGT